MDYFTKDNLFLGLAGYAAYRLALRPTFSFVRIVYTYMLRPRHNLQERYGANSWAIITGSTNGIGAGFAEQLAEEGFNLILVGRSTAKLETQKELLGKKFKEIQIETRLLDLSSTKVQDFIELGDSVSHMDISLLVNNAGWGALCPFQEFKYEELENMINLNIGPYVYLTRNILPRMLKRDKLSGIIFTASIAADFITPCIATYSGTKAFVDHFAKCLAYENPDKIDVLSFKPFTVQSNAVRMEPSFSVLTAKEAANSALDKLGWDIETEGHWRHKYVNAKRRAKIRLTPEKTLMRNMNQRMRRIAKAINQGAQTWS